MSQTGYFHQVSSGRYMTPRPRRHSEEKNYDYQIRLHLVGDPGTGKTSLINQYACEEMPMCRLNNSSKENLPRKKFLEKNKKRISLQIVDTAGQERYRSLTSSYYCQAHGCLIVFDLSRESTFHNVSRWSHQIHEYAPVGICILLVGNNCQSKKREVSKERAEKLASSIGLEYVEVSTRDQVDITKPFDRLIDMVIESLEKEAMLYRQQDKTESRSNSCVIS